MNFMKNNFSLVLLLSSFSPLLGSLAHAYTMNMNTEMTRRCTGIADSNGAPQVLFYDRVRVSVYSPGSGFRSLRGGLLHGGGDKCLWATKQSSDNFSEIYENSCVTVSIQSNNVAIHFKQTEKTAYYYNLECKEVE